MDLEQQLAADRVEARSVAFTDVDPSNDGWTFTGYAAVFDHEADLGEFTESINRGAFRKAIPSSGNIPMLYDHNPMLPVLATTAGGSLRVSEDTKGLKVEADIAKHYMGEAVRELVQRGDIRGMSFGFVAGAGNSKLEHRGNKPHRSLVGFKKLLDVSPTWDPAYQGTSAELRSLRALQIADDIEQAQQFLGGAYQQPGEGAPADDGTTVDPPQDPPEEADEQRSGADSPPEWEVAAAARSRRLQMLGIALPRI